MTTMKQPRAGEPTLFITKDKQRVKQHGNQTVYLKNGEEFELELFNPTTKKILAQITLNEVSLGNGIILRPGERVFLERYLDDAKKFIFETYTVDKNNKQVLDAIKNNGKVSVRFYEELTNNIVWNNGSSTVWINHNDYVGGDPDWHIPTVTCEASNGSIDISGSQCNYSATVTPTNGNITYTSGVDMLVMDSAPAIDHSDKYTTPFVTRETGRIEKGSDSDQEFDYDGTPFNSYPSWTDEWHIQPFSEKVYTKEELPAVYCTGCGAKRKKDTHKFCPICGTKY
jgi:hypothetical protein